MVSSEQHVAEIARSIYNQLIAIKPKEVMSWGSNEFGCTIREFGGVSMGSLTFKISTPKIPTNGRVFISLDGSCTESLDESLREYIVEAVTEQGGKIEKIIGKKEHVHVKDLYDAINSLIEDEETMTHIFWPGFGDK